MAMGPLWEATRDLHHRAEQHPLAQRMAAGTVTDQEWADWLSAHWTIQIALDPHLPPFVRRADAFARDVLDMLPTQPNASPAAEAFAAAVRGPITIFGAAYLFIGAHRRGGRVIEKALRAAGRNLPSRHLLFDDPAAVEVFIRDLRERPTLAPGARCAFAALIEVMDEIEACRNKRNRV